MEKQKIAVSIAQAKQLIKLLPPHTADMCYTWNLNTGNCFLQKIEDVNVGHRDVLTWSYGNLLSILGKKECLEALKKPLYPITDLYSFVEAVINYLTNKK